MNAALRLAIVVALVVIGVLAVLGLTPVIPQSVVIAAFFGGGAVTLVHMGRKRSA